MRTLGALFVGVGLIWAWLAFSTGSGFAVGDPFFLIMAGICAAIGYAFFRGAAKSTRLVDAPLAVRSSFRHHRRAVFALAIVGFVICVMRLMKLVVNPGSSPWPRPGWLWIGIVGLACLRIRQWKASADDASMRDWRMTAWRVGWALIVLSAACVAAANFAAALLHWHFIEETLAKHRYLFQEALPGAGAALAYLAEAIGSAPPFDLEHPDTG